MRKVTEDRASSTLGIIEAAITLYRGRGDGTLGPPEDFFIPEHGVSVQGISSGDFDGDRRVDLIAYSAGPRIIVDELKTGDLDGDGRLDLVGISLMENTATVLLNRF